MFIKFFDSKAMLAIFPNFTRWTVCLDWYFFKKDSNLTFLAAEQVMADEKENKAKK